MSYHLLSSLVISVCSTVAETHSEEVTGHMISLGYIHRVMVLASRASGCLFGHRNPKKNPSRHSISLCGISKNVNLKLIIQFFHLLIIPMALFNDIIPYFDEFIYVYG